MISEEIQKELRNKYNPEHSILRQHQNRMSCILSTVADICERNNIDYWLTHGTLLGAARHGGFIPWDDDVDICILRRDRKRFQLAMMDSLPSDLALQCHSTDSNYYHPYYKIRDVNSEIKETGDEDLNYKYRGIYRDVFPVELAHQFLVKNSFRAMGGGIISYYTPPKINTSKVIKE